MARKRKATSSTSQNMQPVPLEMSGLEHDDTVGPHDFATYRGAEPIMLGIPRELRIQILSYVVFQPEVIDMATQKSRTVKRRWTNELRRLGTSRDTSRSKQTRQSTTPSSCALVCREFYICGRAAFWESNTFAFDTAAQLEGFLQTATSIAKQYLKTMVFGAGYHDLYPSRMVELDGIRQRAGHDPHPEWPSSLRTLSAFKGLKKLDVCTDIYLESPGPRRAQRLPPNGILPESVIRSQLCEGPNDAAPYDKIDQILQSVPDHILDSLTTLRIRYRDFTAPLGQPFAWKTHDCLEYARDSRTSAWSLNMEKLNTMRKSPKSFRLWIEARAAVHWNPNPPVSLAPLSWSFQWCNWYQTWLLLDPVLEGVPEYELPYRWERMRRQMPKPRSKEQMIEEGVWPFDD